MKFRSENTTVFKYIPGFRSGKTIKKVIAIIYYVISLLCLASGVGNFLVVLSMPFLILNAITGIRVKSKPHLCVAGAALLLFIIGCVISPPTTSQDQTDNKQLSETTEVAPDSTKQEDIEIEETSEGQKPEETGKKDTSEKEKATDNVLHIGDTWIVDGQWELTIDSFKETSERNQFATTDPAHVYEITYTYKNLGYDDNILNGLYFDFNSLTAAIVDSAGIVGDTYPNVSSNPPKETPIGATCTATDYIGVENAGAVTINIKKANDKFRSEKATYELIPE